MPRNKQILIYFFTYFFNAGLSFAVVSLLTHRLSTEDYGIINLYSAFLTLAMSVISGGILYPLSVEYYKKSTEDYKSYFTNAQAIPIISLAVFTGGCLLFQHALASFLNVSPFWIIIIPVVVWMLILHDLTLLFFRMKELPWKFAIFAISKNLVEIILTIALVIGLKWTWEGRLTAAVTASLIFGIISIVLFFKWKLIAGKIQWNQVRTIAWVSVPFIFERLSVFLLSNSDRYFIDNYSPNGTSEVGLYSVGAQIAAIVFLAILSMGSAYQPYIFKTLAAKEAVKARKSTGLYILAGAVFVGILFLSIPLLFRFFIGDNFQGGKTFAYYLTGGYFMWAVYNAYLPYLLFHGKSRLVLYLSLSGMLISLGLNFYMVPAYGPLGAAITSIITYSVMGLSTMFFAWKYQRP